MPFQDHAEYPRGLWHTRTLTNSKIILGIFPPKVPFPGQAIKVSHIELKGGAAQEQVIFETEDESAEYFRITLAAGENLIIPRGWQAEDGIKISTATAAGDVTATVFFVEP
jgi:hypothetical protein